VNAGGDAGRAEQLDGVLGVLVEVGVEDALVLEVQPGADVEQIPPQIVQLQRGQHVGLCGDGSLELLAVVPDRLLMTVEHLGDDVEAVARRGAREDRPVAPRVSSK
jgi:hypothetical protein